VVGRAAEVVAHDGDRVVAGCAGRGLAPASLAELADVVRAGRQEVERVGTGRVATARAGRGRRGDDVGERGVRGELDRPAVQPGLGGTSGAAAVLVVPLEAADAALAAVAQRDRRLSTCNDKDVLATRPVSRIGIGPTGLEFLADSVRSRSERGEGDFAVA